MPERDRYFSKSDNFGDKLIENLDKRYTIDVLSSGFLMNQTTLKAVFKKVSGKTIASYMKDYRMKKAAEILKESDMLLLTLQARSDTPQSKFSQEFKESYGVVPSRCRQEQMLASFKRQ
ncbi:helix-turn-helix domain-containing protein [Ligilactobacillus ruminis]|uniref:helix-turn-helix domain-containing protein n=1 Tax=Ligilactobacillus ruminis TaxID=1623 RepID=UPI003F98A512